MIPNIPERVFYRIKEVCTLTGLKPHILRYWEQEFRDIKPVKSSRGQRLYTKKGPGCDFYHQEPSLRKTIHNRRRKEIFEHAEDALCGD